MYKALLRLETQVTQATAGCGELVVVGYDHPAFAGGDKLVGVKAEGADVAKASARLAAIGLPVHLSGVLNDL